MIAAGSSEWVEVQMVTASEIQPPLGLRIPLPVGEWLPDETIFSLASRHHVVACNRRGSDTCMQLFGHARVGSKHDVPSRLDTFVARTGGQLGSVEEIVFERTILPLYFPLTSKERMEDIIRTVRDTMTGSLRYPLYMLLNRFSAVHPLKACEQCIDEDVKQFQVAYWHRAHQYPGVWICPTHNRELREITMSIGRSRGYGWSLPRKEHFARASNTCSLASVEPDRTVLLCRLAFAAAALAALTPNVFIEKERAVRTYRNRLIALGMRSTSGELQLSRCVTSVLEAAMPLRSVPELLALPANERQARAYIMRLTWLPVQNMHVLLHLFSIVWLFRNWNCFWDSYLTCTG
ncbi:hypothetical protein C0Z18_31435 [Trinickia dabaoshanensis]|uniref:TniQ domain-containing protein n=2 Tax=Trinickia dabaoshanensis TaxID=564714 RepID=A0A2N7VBD0_9BURK|nr:hypothetical protein C0Z18_31435 [Trinickia dabaoshanensis]